MARIRIEKRLSSPRWLPVASLAGGLLLALLTVAVIFAALGVNPLVAFQRIFRGGFGSLYGLQETVTKSIPLMLIGVGLTLAFRGRMYNIGAEGQFMMGAIFATGIVRLFPQWPFFLLLTTMFLAGFVGGALWAGIPALLKTRFRVDETLTSLMMVYVAYEAVKFLVYGPWRGSDTRGFPITDEFPLAAQIPILTGTRIHYPTLLIALLAAVVVYVLLTRTKLGYEIRVSGENPEAARYAGMDFRKVALVVMLISGGLAGLAGMGEVAGIHFRLRPPEAISPGYGFTAIIVAWLARLNPLAAILTAFLLGGLLVGGDAIQIALNLPAATVQIFNGVILLFVIASELFNQYRFRLEK
ncbi:MAG: ABC transporter permease [Anaerolineae bacterium]|nr:MAG: ABC transporter permease [Anaerolineae bacterium]